MRCISTSISVQTTSVKPIPTRLLICPDVSMHGDVFEVFRSRVHTVQSFRRTAADHRHPVPASIVRPTPTRATSHVEVINVFDACGVAEMIDRE